MGAGVGLADLEPVEHFGHVGLRRAGAELDERLYHLAVIREGHAPAFEPQAREEAAVMVAQIETIGARSR